MPVSSLADGESIAVRGAADMWVLREHKASGSSNEEGEGGREGALPEDSTRSHQMLIHPVSWPAKGHYGNSPMRG